MANSILPVSLDPWHTIVEVGWGSSNPIVVVEYDTVGDMYTYASEVAEGVLDDDRTIQADPPSALGVPIPADDYKNAAVFIPGIRHKGAFEVLLPSYGPNTEPHKQGFQHWLSLMRDTLEAFTEDPATVHQIEEFYRQNPVLETGVFEYTGGVDMFSGQSMSPNISFFYRLYLGFHIGNSPTMSSIPFTGQRTKESIIVNFKNTVACHVQISGHTLSKGLVECKVSISAYPPTTIFTPEKEGPPTAPLPTGRLIATAPPPPPKAGAPPPQEPVFGDPVKPIWTFEETMNDNYTNFVDWIIFDKKGRIT